jgi:hypothetical protein
MHGEGRIWSKMWKKRYWKLWMMNVKDLNVEEIENYTSFVDLFIYK